MKKLITILIAGLFTLASYGQSGVARFTGIQLGTTPVAYNITSTNSYVIEKVGSTYYARPGIGTGLTAYSSATFKTMMDNVQAALTTGGTIFIKAGLYDNLPVGAITIVNDKITIIGAGKYLTILKLKVSADVGLIKESGLIDYGGKSNTTISDLQLDGNGANQTLIDNGASQTAILNGILIYDNVDWDHIYHTTIEDCYIHDFTQFGIYVDIATYGLIRNCRVSNNYWNNIQLSHLSSFYRVLDNYCEGSADVSITNFGTDSEINRNTIMDCDGVHGSSNGNWGIALESYGGSKPIKNKIINNTITGATTKVGIWAGSGGYDNNFENNIINSHIMGMQILTDSSSVIKSNTISGFTDSGIRLEGCEEMDVSENNVSGSGTMALYLTNVGGAYSINNVIKNNILLNSAGFGINIDATSNGNAFLNNIISGAAWGDVNGAELVTGSIWSKNWVKKTGNWFYETGKSSIAATATSDGLTTGIIAQGSQNLTVTSNTNDVYIISLPAASAATVGTKITGLLVGSKICKLRTQSAQEASVYINGVTGAGKGAAIPVASTFEVIQVDATHWILKAWTTLGAVITAIVPA